MDAFTHLTAVLQSTGSVQNAALGHQAKQHLTSSSSTFGSTMMYNTHGIHVCIYIYIHTYSFQPRHMAYMHHDVHLSFCHMFTSFEIALQPVASEIGSSQNTFTRSFNKLHPGKRTSSSLRPRNQAQVDAILDSTLLTSSMIHGPFLGENHGNHGSYHGCQTSKFGTFGEIWHLRFFSSKPWLSQNHPMLCTRPQVPPQLGPATFLERSLVSPRCMVIPPYNVRKAITRHSYFDGVYIYICLYMFIYHPKKYTIHKNLINLGMVY